MKALCFVLCSFVLAQTAGAELSSQYRKCLNSLSLVGQSFNSGAYAVPAKRFLKTGFYVFKADQQKGAVVSFCELPKQSRPFAQVRVNWGSIDPQTPYSYVQIHPYEFTKSSFSTLPASSLPDPKNTFVNLSCHAANDRDAENYVNTLIKAAVRNAEKKWSTTRSKLETKQFKAYLQALEPCDQVPGLQKEITSIELKLRNELGTTSGPRAHSAGSIR